MNCFAGIDIGSTNCKLLVAAETGKIILEKSLPTPYQVIKNLSFFNLEALDALVDGFIASAKELGNLCSVGFSSVGESTVPVRGGKALFSPPLWSEALITANQSQRETLNKYINFQLLGINQNQLLALDKILYLRTHIPAFRQAEYYLPLSSYQIYRKTGSIAWEYSQASRSNAFLVHEKKWFTELLEAFGLDEFGTLGPMGSHCGEHAGITYGLGGHDHITGLFGVYNVLGNQENFFYDSMGTSSVLTMATTYPDVTEHYNPAKGSILCGFIPTQHIITKSFRRFGALIANWMEVTQTPQTPENFKKINALIEEKEFSKLSFLLTCDGDYTLGNTNTGALNYLNYDTNARLPDLIQSTYLYLVTLASQLEHELKLATEIKQEVPYLAGGGIVRDTFFMRLKATALGHPIQCLATGEISALGALTTGLYALHNREVLQNLRNELLATSFFYYPDERLEKRVAQAKEAYTNLQKNLHHSSSL